MSGLQPIVRTWGPRETAAFEPHELPLSEMPMTDSPELSVVIPAFDEEQGIRGQLESIVATLADSPWTFEIVVVDDGSEDATASQAEGLEHVTVVRHGANRGYGAALKTGIRRARGEYIVITDADGTYPAAEIPRLLAEIDSCDMVVGARTGKDVAVPFLRKPAKWMLRKLAEFLAETQIPDLNSGLRVFRKSEVMRYLPILCSGFSFTTTVTLAMLCTDRLVRYLPIDYLKREGRSKIRPLRDTYNFLLLVLRTICYFNPLKVFMPATFTLFGMGAAKLAYELIRWHHVASTEVMLLVMGVQLGALGLIADAVSKSRALPTEDRGGH